MRFRGITENGRREHHTRQRHAARIKKLKTYRRLADEDIVLLRRQGLVPLAIADRLGVGLRRVVAVLREAGEEIPSYPTTSI